MNDAKNFRPQSFIFDLFNAVVDPDGYRPKGFSTPQKIAELFNLNSPPFEKFWNDSVHIRNTSKSRKPLDLIEDYVARNGARPPSKGDLLLVDTFLGRYHDMALQSPKSEVIVELHNLKYQGMKLGLLANTSEREISTWFRSPLAGLFEAAGFSCNTGFEMPSKEAYSQVLARMSVSASTSIFVGGADRSSLQGAKDFGFGSVVFMEGFAARHHLHSDQEMVELESLADSTIQRISELGDLPRLAVPRTL